MVDRDRQTLASLIVSLDCFFSEMTEIIYPHMGISSIILTAYTSIHIWSLVALLRPLHRKGGWKPVVETNNIINGQFLLYGSRDDDANRATMTYIHASAYSATRLVILFDATLYTTLIPANSTSHY